MTGKRRVSEWGPPKAADYPIGFAYADGQMGWLTEKLNCWAVEWVEWWPMPIPDHFEDPPLPAPWRPMSELEDGHERAVLIAYADGTSIQAVKLSHRSQDGQRAPGHRVAWCELPTHPSALYQSQEGEES